MDRKVLVVGADEVGLEKNPAKHVLRANVLTDCIPSKAPTHAVSQLLPSKRSLCESSPLVIHL